MVGMKGTRSPKEAKRSAQTGMTTDLRETKEGKVTSEQPLIRSWALPFVGANDYNIYSNQRDWNQETVFSHCGSAGFGGSYRPNPPRRLVARSKKALATIFVRGSPNIGPGLICARGGEPGWKGKGTVGVGEEVPWL